MNWTVALLGGVLGLDATTVGQFMVSRPIVAGAATGWLVGDLGTGIAVGATLEAYALASLPSGGAQLPDTTVATVVATTAATTGNGMGAFAIAIAFGLAWGQVGGLSMKALRHITARLVPLPDSPSLRVRQVGRAHLSAIFLDLIRGVLLTGTGVALGSEAVHLGSGVWPASPSTTLGIVLVGGAVSFGILIGDLYRVPRRLALLGVGFLAAACGGVLL